MAKNRNHNYKYVRISARIKEVCKIVCTFNDRDYTVLRFITRTSLEDGRVIYSEELVDEFVPLERIINFYNTMVDINHKPNNGIYATFVEV